MKPLVSVIMPVHNSERYVGAAIESILAQSYSNFEFIIIDDCSTDTSWDIIQKYAKKDTRIKAVRNEKNLKIVKTRNKGFRLANKDAKYYAIMDSDDISLPKRLEKQVQFLEMHASYGAVGGHNIIINSQGKTIGYRRYTTSWRAIKRSITRVDPLSQPSTMIRAEAIKKVGPYNERYTRCQDYELWLRIATIYKITNLDTYLLQYRISETQGKSTHLKKTLKFTLEIQKKWLFHKKFFRIENALYHIGLRALLVMPKQTILKLFKLISYTKEK